MPRLHLDHSPTPLPSLARLRLRTAPAVMPSDMTSRCSRCGCCVYVLRLVPRWHLDHSPTSLPSLARPRLRIALCVFDGDGIVADAAFSFSRRFRAEMGFASPRASLGRRTLADKSQTQYSASRAKYPEKTIQNQETRDPFTQEKATDAEFWGFPDTTVWRHLDASGSIQSRPRVFHNTNESSIK